MYQSSVKTIDTARANHVAAMRVLGWVKDPSMQHWMKLTDEGYRVYRAVSDFHPADNDQHALAFIHELGKLSPLWFIQTELQGGIWRAFIEHEGERRVGFYKHEYFSLAVTVAALGACGIGITDIEDRYADHHKQLPRNTTPVAKPQPPDNANLRA